jgi:hypothetical protein
MIDVQESANYLHLIEKVERSLQALKLLEERNSDLSPDIAIIKSTLDELIKRNIQAYLLIVNFSRYENQVLIGNAELSLYKRLADKFPEYHKYFVR